MISEIEKFSVQNNMKINHSKTRVMKFSRSVSLDFPLEIAFSDNINLEVINSTKLLGVIINSQLKWDDNTHYICKKARKKIW